MIHIYDVTTCVTYLWALLGVGRDPIACLATHLKRLAQRLYNLQAAKTDFFWSVQHCLIQKLLNSFLVWAINGQLGPRSNVTHLSSSHFLIHFLIRWHLTGSCQFSLKIIMSSGSYWPGAEKIKIRDRRLGGECVSDNLQEKQKVWPQAHFTGRASTCCTLKRNSLRRYWLSGFE